MKDRATANNARTIDKWNSLDKETQEKLLENVFCSKCHVTTIIDYKLTSSDPDIVLKGKCQKCGGNVARLIEWEWFN